MEAREVVNDFGFEKVDGRLTLDEDEMCLRYVAATRGTFLINPHCVPTSGVCWILVVE
ncbi:hypothetical protein [Paraburkholderia sp. LEh10]|uniref:hypothetical protein n=1 Tax=Paraburkholderia sp. LEh10 TaxID=2821353 RepID=UPI001FD73F77|nr:hypothetical protein [Paraburkholderia sp. LEh10]